MADLAFGALAMGAQYGASSLAQSMEPPPYGPDTSVPGVSSATIRQKGKNDEAVTVPQADIGQALQWYRQAATEQTSALEKGYNMYTTALKSAASELRAGYANANDKLKPMSSAATDALNEQMRFLGMDPIQPSTGLSGDLGLAADNLISINPAAGNQLKALQSQLDVAEQLKDPGQRAAAKSNIMQQIDSVKGQVGSTLQDQMGKIKSNIPEYTPISDKDALAKLGHPKDNYKDWIGPIMDVRLKDRQAYDAKVAGDIAGQKAELQQKYDSATGAIGSLADRFGAKYSETPLPGAYTGQQVVDKIEATPGYAYEFEQGQKAIERQAAAKGMLGSGNTLLAAQKEGQSLAQNYFNVHMDRLAQIVNEGSPATLQMANNDVQAGRDYSQLWEAGGQAGMATQGKIGEAKAQSLYNQGALYSDAAKFNATMQYSGIQAAQNRDAQMAQAAMSQQPIAANANLNQQKFNYSVAQNQQAGQAFYGGGSGVGGATGSYNSYGLNFPTYVV